eukprot:5832920-Amphidinium_carterae.1
MARRAVRASQAWSDRVASHTRWAVFAVPAGGVCHCLDSVHATQQLRCVVAQPSNSGFGADYSTIVYCWQNCAVAQQLPLPPAAMWAFGGSGR